MGDSSEDRLSPGGRAAHGAGLPTLETRAGEFGDRRASKFVPAFDVAMISAMRKKSTESRLAPCYTIPGRPNAVCALPVRGRQYAFRSEAPLQPAMFNIVFCLAVPHSRRQRLAASQVTSPRDTCGARAPRDTPIMEWWSNMNTAEMSISYQHPSSPISVARSRHRDTGRCGRPQKFRFHPKSWEPGG